MDNQATENSDRELERLNSRFAWFFAGLTGVLCLVLVGLANDPWVLEGFRRAAWAQAAWKKQIPLICFQDHFLDSADRVMHQDLNTADYSRPGVCLIGASSLSWGLRLWDLPSAIRSRIHNFAIGGTNHGDQYELIRFLVEKEGMLRAGADKSLVVIGISYHTAAHTDDQSPGIGTPESRGRWHRRGCYVVDGDGSISRSNQNPLWTEILNQRAKMAGILGESVSLLYTPFKPVRKLDPEYSRAEWTRTLGPRWEGKIKKDVASFEAAVRYLHERGVPTLVMALPEGRWNEETEYESVYMRAITATLAKYGVEILDLRKRIPDDDFADTVHLNPEGMAKFQALLMPRIMDHPRSTGGPVDR